MSLRIVYKCKGRVLLTQNLLLMMRAGRPCKIVSNVDSEPLTLRQCDEFTYKKYSDPQSSVLSMACALWAAASLRLCEVENTAQISLTLINIENNQVILTDATTFDEIEVAIRSHWNMGPLEQSLAQSTSPPSSLPSKICASCGAEANNYCGKCRIVCYCSRECQMNHWKTHKPMCNK